MAWTLAVPLGVCEVFASRPDGERRTPSLHCFQKRPAHERLSFRRTSSYDTESTTMKTSDNVDISTSTEESPQLDTDDVPQLQTEKVQVSGMPTSCIPVKDGGVGFDYRQVDTDDVPQVDTDDVPQLQTEKVQVSGMPTSCIPVKDGGVGFDHRLHVAIVPSRGYCT